jgi:hypothetical protein
MTFLTLSPPRLFQYQKPGINPVDFWSGTFGFWSGLLRSTHDLVKLKVVADQDDFFLSLLALWMLACREVQAGADLLVFFNSVFDLDGPASRTVSNEGHDFQLFG